MPEELPLVVRMLEFFALIAVLCLMKRYNYRHLTALHYRQRRKFNLSPKVDDTILQRNRIGIYSV